MEESRWADLERTYVHGVYDQLAPLLDPQCRPWPRVACFLQSLDPGSSVLDVGCGTGRYLDLVPGRVAALGCERCGPLVRRAARKGHEAIRGDALALPLRDRSVDAALAMGLLHHLGTAARRARALAEMARVLRLGGRLLLTALAAAPLQLKSFDLLIPWADDLECNDDFLNEESVECSGRGRLSAVGAYIELRRPEAELECPQCRGDLSPSHPPAKTGSLGSLLSLLPRLFKPQQDTGHVMVRSQSTACCRAEPPRCTLPLHRQATLDLQLLASISESSLSECCDANILESPVNSLNGTAKPPPTLLLNHKNKSSSFSELELTGRRCLSTSYMLQNPGTKEEEEDSDDSVVSSSPESLEGGTGDNLVPHRYYHAFQEGELESLIEAHVESLHIVSRFTEFGNICVIAEKVQVWTI